MQFKFKHSKISLNTKASGADGFDVKFCFEQNATEIYQSITNNNAKSELIDKMDAVGSITTYNNQILVSLGSSEKLNFDNLTASAVALSKFISSRLIKEINFIFDGISLESLNISFGDCVERYIVDFINGLYYFDDFKSQKIKLELSKINVITEENINQNLKNAIAILGGYFVVRDLANNPSNIATPTYLANVAEDFKKLNKNVEVEIFDEKAIRKMGMNAFLGVAKDLLRNLNLSSLNIKV